MTDDAKKDHRLLIALAIIAVLLAVTWALATFFEIERAKALAALILLLFVVALGMVLMGVGV